MRRWSTDWQAHKTTVVQSAKRRKLLAAGASGGLGVVCQNFVQDTSRTHAEIVRRAFETGRAESREVKDAGQLPAFIQVLIELHQKRRQSLGDPGCFSDPVFTKYHREVMERFFALGRLRLQYVLLEGRPVAIEYGLVGGNTIYFYQSGIEPEILDERPGWMGTIGSLRAAIRAGLPQIRFHARRLGVQSVVGARRSRLWRRVSLRGGRSCTCDTRPGLHISRCAAGPRLAGTMAGRQRRNLKAVNTNRFRGRRNDVDNACKEAARRCVLPRDNALSPAAKCHTDRCGKGTRTGALLPSRG